MRSYLSVKQVRERLNGAISTRLVYKLIEAGKLRVNRSLGKVLVCEESLERLLESGDLAAVSDPRGTADSGRGDGGRRDGSTPTRSS